MIELIETIIKTEENLKNKEQDIQNEAQGILVSTRRKITILAEEFENDFQKEKSEKTGIVMSKAAIYEDELKKKIQNEIVLKKQNLEKRKQDLKDKIVQTILEL